MHRCRHGVLACVSLVFVGCTEVTGNAPSVHGSGAAPQPTARRCAG